jgi:hypothetical protein
MRMSSVTSAPVRQAVLVIAYRRDVFARLWVFPPLRPFAGIAAPGLRGARTGEKR